MKRWPALAYLTVDPGLDGDSVFVECATLKQLVDAVDGQKSGDIRIETWSHWYPDGVGRHKLSDRDREFFVRNFQVVRIVEAKIKPVLGKCLG